ncbi:MAG TPA: TlyA family RNA methyltransferase [Spirochaetota bacterium]|nr:TlyA family RNA methyltransferase [Spirochaetota bacterium]
MKIRLDKYLFDEGFSDSREKAKNEIIAGYVKLNGETVRDPSFIIKDKIDIIITRPENNFVSRGGEKINKALKYFSIDVNESVCADLGASTGGFTDCLLQRGAKKVYAVDVGYGQLDYRLRTDKRVIVMERTNARTISPELFDETISFFVSDLSFISFTKIFPAVRIVAPSADGVFLLKPQFESEGFELKKGVVRNDDDRLAIIQKTLRELTSMGMMVKGFTYSPIKGPKGNIEYLVHYSMQNSDKKYDDEMILKAYDESLSLND